MSEELLVMHGSPTLAGIKTANLFSIPYEEEQILHDSICELNKKLVPKGLRVIPIKKMDKRILVYIYRPTKLKEDVMNEKSLSILKNLGYLYETPERYLVALIHKLNCVSEFPHEIGLFLGYPPEDVEGFIENKADCSKCTGCWKVYGDVESAQKKFEQYRVCTQIYYSRWKMGTSIKDLTVAK